MTKFLVLNNLDQLECYVAGYSNTIGLSLRRSLVLSGHCAALALIHHLLLLLEKERCFRPIKTLILRHQSKTIAGLSIAEMHSQ